MFVITYGDNENKAIEGIDVIGIPSPCFYTNTKEERENLAEFC